MDIELFKQTYCTKLITCWQLGYAKVLELNEGQMLDVCFKCIYYKENKREDK
jgi:hypothetical protein